MIYIGLVFILLYLLLCFCFFVLAVNHYFNGPPKS